MSKPVINVDVDGVLYDFTEAMRRELRYNGIEVPDTEMRTWELHHTWPVTRKQVYEIMYAGILAGRVFRYGPVVDEMEQDALHDLRAAGWHVRLVTAKTFHDREVTKVARHSTLEWLYDVQIPYDTIAFTDGHGKTDLRADVVVDDKPKLHQWCQWGALNILYHQPWNSEVELVPDMTLSRARSWMQIRRELLWEADDA